MKVTLLHYTPLWVASNAIRACWQSGEKSDTKFFNEDHSEEMTKEDHDTYEMGEKDCNLIDEVGNKYKHASTLEHVSFNFYIKDVSRAVLQELARHRIASPSVKSTRYTLKELKKEEPFIYSSDDIKHLGDKSFYETDLGIRSSKYLVYTGEELVDYFSVFALENLRQVLVAGISNDKAKYCLPESYKTELAWTINIRSLQNFLNLRSDKSALWEIRDLAKAVYEALPDESRYLFEIKTYE